MPELCRSHSRWTKHTQVAGQRKPHRHLPRAEEMVVQQVKPQRPSKKTGGLAR